MAVQLIPTAQNAFFNLQVSMDGTAYLLTFYYNQRESCYYMTISDTAGNDFVTGIKCLANWPLLHKWSVTGLPPGELLIVSNTGSNDPPPSLGQLGDGQAFTMFYTSESQMP